MRRQSSVLFHGPTSKGWVCWGRPDRIPQDDVATTMATPEMMTTWRDVDDELIVKLTVRVEMSTRMPLKGGGDERLGSKPKKIVVAEATKMIHRVWQGVFKIDRKGLCSLH